MASGVLLLVGLPAHPSLGPIGLKSHTSKKLLVVMALLDASLLPLSLLSRGAKEWEGPQKCFALGSTAPKAGPDLHYGWHHYTVV